tara:strand:+ start:275 stop:418 length:144 start_codon:yes stop_codon:yes gene_type:complete
MALDKQNIHKSIVQIENKVGAIFVNPSVVFKNPFEAIPEMIAPTKNK